MPKIKMTLNQIHRELKETLILQKELSKKQPERKRDTGREYDKNGKCIRCWDGYKSNPEWEEWHKEYLAVEKKISSLEKEIKKIKYVEIKNPETLIAGRVEKGYGGKVVCFDVNDLTRIALSDTREEGNIQLPYKFNFNGEAKKVDVANTYRIKRDGKKVYWVLDFYTVRDY